jgi:hypothetical protein
MPPLFLDAFARPLLVVHALAAFALLGACTHQAVIALGLLRGRNHLARLARVHARTTALLFVLAFSAGLLLYPHYRYRVRGLYLDRYAPWASNLFDLKENLLALGLPLALAVAVLGWRLEPRSGRAVLPVFAGCALGLWGLVLFGSVAGLLVTSVKGVG